MQLTLDGREVPLKAATKRNHPLTERQEAVLNHARYYGTINLEQASAILDHIQDVPGALKRLVTRGLLIKHGRDLWGPVA